MKPKAFFVVGHANWGKSRTLRALTGGLHRNISIGPRTFFIRRTSNDDDPQTWEEAINQLDPNTTPYVILTVCPTQEALPVLRILRERFTLYFWVIRHSYHGNRKITPEEEQRLQTVGTIEILDQVTEDGDRAVHLRNFIDAHP
jgi:hypothetical protein